jgi:hypothetical protein
MRAGVEIEGNTLRLVRKPGGDEGARKEWPCGRNADKVCSRKRGPQMMRKFALAAVMLGLSALQAYAQSSQPTWQDPKGPAIRQDPNSNPLRQQNEEPLRQLENEERKQLEDEERKRQAKDLDADYDRAMKRSRTTTPNAAVDPWQNVRPGK